MPGVLPESGPVEFTVGAGGVIKDRVVAVDPAGPWQVIAAAVDSATPIGVALETVAVGGKVDVAINGFVEIEVSAAIDEGNVVVCAALGQIKPGVFPTTHDSRHVVGRAVTPQAVVGQKCYVNLAC